MKRRTAFLMPAYNPTREDLARTVNSLLAQTADADIVIIDDGSRAPVSEILAPHAGIILLRLDRNQGITAALNHGLEYIVKNGYEFVARMDCGDICAQNRIAKQEAYMDAHPSTDLLGAFADIVDEHGNHLFFEGTSGGRAAIGRKLRDNAAFKHPTFFFRTSSIQKLGGYSTDYPHAEDYEFMLRVYKEGNIDCLDDVLVIYEKNSGSISSKNRSAQLRSRLRIQLKHLEPASPSAYVGIARTIVTLLVPAPLWARFSQSYWDRAGGRGVPAKARLLR
ncbi:MAG: glycosyltransferase [Rhizobiales bacterium]|nr:glycosyltransferase [Hyphomicrobiales bacterium]